MEKNLRTYNSSSVVNWYSELKEIIPVEKIIFEKFNKFILNSDLLDIGIGGGRTTHYLINTCKKYTGIDYSQSFINSVKNIYPKADVSVMDARDLSFKDNSFDFVNFSFNGLDYTDLEGRQKIMLEIARVLKPGGVFFFSTHNKNHSSYNLNPWVKSDVSFFTNIKTFIKLFPFIGRKLRNKKNEIIAEDYAIINDSAHNYNLMTFYTAPTFLKTELQGNRFTEINFYDKSGNITEDEKLDDWIFVICKKISA